MDAFSKLNDERVKLILCGTGDAEDYIAQKQKDDKRIFTLGRVDRVKALQLQKGAAILVNPRQNNEDFTKFSFPSKNLEYLSSGTPTVAYKLDGIPDEYDDYIIYPADDSVEALRDELVRLLDMSEDERRVLGETAKSFVCANKCKKSQAKRIIDFLR